MSNHKLLCFTVSTHVTRDSKKQETTNLSQDMDKRPLLRRGAMRCPLQVPNFTNAIRLHSWDSLRHDPIARQAC